MRIKQLLTFLFFSMLVSQTQADASYTWRAKHDNLAKEKEVLIDAFVAVYGKNTTREEMARACDEIIRQFKTLEEDTYVLSAFENNQCIGVVFVHYDQFKSSAYIAQLAVKPAVWGKGVGTELLKKVVEHFKLISMTVAVRKTNERAIRFYKNFGFVQIRGVPHGLNPFVYMGLKWKI